MNFEIRANRACNQETRCPTAAIPEPRDAGVGVSHRDPINPPAKCPLIRFPTRHHLDTIPALLRPQPPRPQHAYSLPARPSEQLTLPTLGAYLSPTCPYLSRDAEKCSHAVSGHEPSAFFHLSANALPSDIVFLEHQMPHPADSRFI